MYRELKLQTVTSSEDVSSTYAAPLSDRVLMQQNHTFLETVGVSAGNRDQGFRPVFLDQSTGTTWLPCFANGFRYRCPINPTPWYEVGVSK